jgi:hypothetical protein
MGGKQVAVNAHPWRRAASSKLIAKEVALEGLPPQPQPEVQVLRHLNDASALDTAKRNRIAELQGALHRRRRNVKKSRNAVQENWSGRSGSNRRHPPWQN